MRLAFALIGGAFLAMLAPSSEAQADVSIIEGGEPGVSVRLAGGAIADASTPGSAILVSPTEPIALSISIAPPANETWEVRSVSVGLLVRGPGTSPPASLTRTSHASASLPPGFTVVLNRSLDLTPIERVGAGTFLMEARVLDAEDASLYAQTFYVRIPATVASLLTAQGAVITAMSAATGYGLWQIGRDAKEARDAWDRHRRKRARAKLDVFGRAEDALERAAEHVNRGLASAVEAHRAAQEKERSLGPVRWAATGLGLGGVAMAWGQFLGFVALDATGIVIVAMEVGAGALTIALLANALLRRRGKAASQPEPEPLPEPSLRLDIQEGPRPWDVASDASNAVHPGDKRG